MRHFRSPGPPAVLIGAILLCACTPNALLPLPASSPEVRAQSAAQAPDLDLLYVTDRAKTVNPSGAVSYGPERSYTVSFGSIDVHGGAGSSGATGDMTLAGVTELGRYPEVPYPAEITAAGYRRAPQVVAAHEQAVATLQGEIRKRISPTDRKEVVVFIHGYNKTFADAAESTANLCRLLGPDFVCLVLTWPAGGSRGAFLGYNVDRESGEFAVSDMRKAIRAIGETPGVRAVDLLGHSRGADVLASALHLLGVESYVSRASIAERLKIRNIVLFAPDIDIDVATTKIFDVFSDPDLPYGARKNLNAVIRQGSLHLTIYSSPSDQALDMASKIFGSRLRLGQLDLTGPEAKALRADPGHFADLIEVDRDTGAFGHGYFLSNPAVRSDLVAMIRDRLNPGDPGRPLIEIGKAFWRIPQGETQTARR
ncbi:esterase/lipase superfamily enzyme [Roseiarcus fermentans]|uniref:Esterase/lipase superfamily enzyme n=1 Tax=Roseiarcus fermentans TaxID=1473586 RepID=A0A366ETS7_9HYPH|nr:alpha/beta hydrolase [Roseiarcus fermentans]RBP05798.1 esterase/lipase superfamily enzyme [Roseiarcus fermentans]